MEWELSGGTLLHRMRSPCRFAVNATTRHDPLLPHEWSSRLDKADGFDKPGHISLRQMPDHLRLFHSKRWKRPRCVCFVKKGASGNELEAWVEINSATGSLIEELYTKVSNSTSTACTRARKEPWMAQRAESSSVQAILGAILT